MPSEHLLFFIPEDSARAVVPPRDLAVVARRDDRIVDLLQHQRLPALFGLNALLFGNVARVDGNSAVFGRIRYAHEPAVPGSIVMFKFDWDLLRDGLPELEIRRGSHRIWKQI